MNENDARVKAYMKAAGLIKTTDDTSKKEDLSIKLPSNVRLEKNENANHWRICSKAREEFFCV